MISGDFTPHSPLCYHPLMIPGVIIPSLILVLSNPYDPWCCHPLTIAGVIIPGFVTPRDPWFFHPS